MRKCLLVARLALATLFSVAGPWAWAQTISVPLGTAAPFGLLSGGTLSTDSATTIQVTGRAGGATAIVGPVVADGGLYRPSGSTANATTSAALADLAAARTYCSGLTSTALTTLNGQTLTGGAYTLTGNTRLSATSPLTLSGSASTIFVINVTGNLAVDTGAVVRLSSGVLSANVYWNLGGTLTAYYTGGLPGCILSGGTVSVSQRWQAFSAILSQSSVSFTGVRTDPTLPQGDFFARVSMPGSLLPITSCASPAIASTGQCPNLVYNGGFELQDPSLPPSTPTSPIPSRLADVCNLALTPAAQGVAQLAAWRGVNWNGSPDWFRAGGTSNVNVPQNARNDASHQVETRTGNLMVPDPNNRGYAGVWATADELYDGDPPAPPLLYREYLSQLTATPLAAKDYYAEFYTHRASESNGSVRGLGLTVLAADPLPNQLTGFGLLVDATNTPIVPLVTANDGNFRGDVWSRTAGCFRATGGEQHVVIGNFDNYAASVFSGGSNLERLRKCYEYIDDVLIQAFPDQIVATTNTGCYRLTVNCPLPATSLATYLWQDVTAGSAPVSTGTSAVLQVALPGHTYTVTVVVPPTGPPPGGGTNYTVLLPSITLGCGYDLCPGDAGLTISGNVVWDGANPPSASAPHSVKGEVVIMPGGKLTIRNLTVGFADTRAYQSAAWRTTPNSNPVNPTRIVVRKGNSTTNTRGGQLIVEGSKLTSDVLTACPSGYMWDGIVVQGNPGVDQHLSTEMQGEITLVSTVAGFPIIEKAHTGIILGAMSYQPVTGGSAGVLADGGGILHASRATIRNCYAGLYLAPYARQNNTLITDCRFDASELLADPNYTKNSVRHSMAEGIRINSVPQLRIYGTSFALLDLNSLTLPVQTGLRMVGIITNNGGLLLRSTTGGQPCRFSRLGQGIGVTNGTLANTVDIIGAQFSGCIYGLGVSGVANGQIAECAFEVGRDAYPFPLGMSLTSCAGLVVQNNTFKANQGSCPGYTECPNARAIILTQMAARPTLIRRNQFRNISAGIYVQRGCTQTQLKCNEFTAPISRADIEVYMSTSGGQQSAALENPQGECNSSEVTPADNVFSQTGYVAASNTCGSAQSIMIGQVNTTANPLQYNTTNSTATLPNCYLSGAVASPATNSVVVTACGPRVNFDYNLACPANTYHRTQSKSQLYAALDTLTNAAARAEVIDELLHRFLSDTTTTTGVDSAVALLGRLNEPGYSPQNNALRVRGGYPPLNSRAAPPVATTGRRLKWAGRRSEQQAPVGVGAQQRTYSDYYEEVADLLAPLGADTAVVAALRADSTLRGRLWQMANDTLRADHVAGRAALAYYLGYQFRPWYEAQGAADSTATAARVTVPARVLMDPTASAPPEAATHGGQGAYLRLYPNPTAGTVQLEYALPAGAKGGQLVLTDKFGRASRTVLLAAAEATAVLELRGLPPGLYQYRLLAGSEQVVSGTLVKLPE